jgi:hypothetical protein
MAGVAEIQFYPSLLRSEPGLGIIFKFVFQPPSWFSLQFDGRMCESVALKFAGWLKRLPQRSVE